MSTRISLHDDLLRSAFQRFDVDNSGYVTKKKLKMLLGDSLSEEELDQVMLEVVPWTFQSLSKALWAVEVPFLIFS